MLRECDNDDCEYETGVRNGRPAVWWVHVPECIDSPEARLPVMPERHVTEFRAFLLGYE